MLHMFPVWHYYGSDATLLIMREIYECYDAVGLAFIGCEVRIDRQGSSNRTQGGVYPGTLGLSWLGKCIYTSKRTRIYQSI